MARCEHITIKRAVAGQQADCSRCGLPVIFNGSKWIWVFSLSPRERGALTTRYVINQITEKSDQ